MRKLLSWLRSFSPSFIIQLCILYWPWDLTFLKSPSFALFYRIHHIENASTNHGLFCFATGLKPSLEHCSLPFLVCLSFPNKDVPSAENILAITGARHRM